jgi:hypothetical protein
MLSHHEVWLVYTLTSPSAYLAAYLHARQPQAHWSTWSSPRPAKTHSRLVCTACVLHTPPCTGLQALGGSSACQGARPGIMQRVACAITPARCRAGSGLSSARAEAERFSARCKHFSRATRGHRSYGVQFIASRICCTGPYEANVAHMRAKSSNPHGKRHSEAAASLDGKFDRASAHFTAHSAPSSSGNSAMSCACHACTHKLCPQISSQRARSAQGRHTPRPKAAAAGGCGLVDRTAGQAGLQQAAGALAA